MLALIISAKAGRPEGRRYAEFFIPRDFIRMLMTGSRRERRAWRQQSQSSRQSWSSLFCLEGVMAFVASGIGRALALFPDMYFWMDFERVHKFSPRRARARALPY